MRDTQTADTMPLHQHFSSWSGMHTKGNKATVAADNVEEPFRKHPAPSAFHTPEILSHFQPDPLLLVTPEKSLGLAQLNRNNSATREVTSVNCDNARKGRQRVRFAPSTQTSSPPALSKNASGSGASSVEVGVEEGGPDADDSVPRNFSSVSQRLYRPALYADSDEETSIKTLFPGASIPSADTAPSKQYVVENRGSRGTIYVPIDQSRKNHITSGFLGEKGNNGKTVNPKVVRHKTPISSEDSDNCEGSDAEVKETLSCLHTSPARKSPVTLSRTSSASPHRNHRPSSCQSSPAAKSPCRSPSSKSPNRLTPTGALSEVFSFSEDGPQPDVRVVREAPLRPKLNDYVFPFHGDKQENMREYDSAMETPLTRPEFNSTVKISEELKSVKAKQPDTWGVVSEMLKKSDSKRTQIQEKASSKVNVQLQSGLFSRLVDIDVPLDDLCQNVEQGITLRAPPSLPPPAKVTVGREPDLMEFFFPDLQQELPDLTLTGIQPVMERLTTANPTLAFDLYRHNRSWDGLTDS